MNEYERKTRLFQQAQESTDQRGNLAKIEQESREDIFTFEQKMVMMEDSENYVFQQDKDSQKGEQ